MSKLVEEARSVARMYASVGHRHGVESLLTRLADKLDAVEYWNDTTDMSTGLISQLQEILEEE